MTRKIHRKNQQINQATYDLLMASPDTDVAWSIGWTKVGMVEMKDADVINSIVDREWYEVSRKKT